MDDTERRLESATYHHPGSKIWNPEWVRAIQQIWRYFEGYPAISRNIPGFQKICPLLGRYRLLPEDIGGFQKLSAELEFIAHWRDVVERWEA